MKRRFVASALWMYFGWYLAAHLAQIFGLPPFIAPLGGVAMLGLAWLDVRSSVSSLRSPRAERAQVEARPRVSE